LEVANPEVRCVVVANPANANAYILSHFSNGKVKKENITCLSRLDHNRAVSQIAKLTGVPVKEVSGIVVLGNHSITQYSCIDTIKVNDQPINRWVDKE
jgi:malate dehydrogenase